MTTSLEYFRIIAPEFSATADASVTPFILLAADFIDASQYTNSELALAYMAASLMYQQKQSSSGQSSGLDLTMEKEGDLQRSYGASNSTSGMTKDIYQQQLDMLARSFAGACIMTRYGI